MVADQDVKALVEADPLEELLLPPAHALINIGRNTKLIFSYLTPFFFYIVYKPYKQYRKGGRSLINVFEENATK